MRLVGEQLSVDGYVRVSRVGGRRGERFISPSVQRELIESWATTHGARVLEVFEELDESGGRADRRLLEKALRRVESGISQGIVVSKVNRFGRSLLSGLAAIERVKAAGGRFVSVQDGLDTSTDSGRLVLHILLSLAEWESDRISAEWEQARASAIKRGVYMSAGSPVGYRKTRSGRLRPAPDAAEAIAEVYRRRADGESFSSLARWFEEQNVRTAYGNPGWTSISTAKLVRSRVYLGEIRQGAHLNEHAHWPLVDAATWQAAQHPRRVVLLHELQPALLARLGPLRGVQPDDERLLASRARNGGGGDLPLPGPQRRWRVPRPGIDRRHVPGGVHRGARLRHPSPPAPRARGRARPSGGRIAGSHVGVDALPRQRSRPRRARRGRLCRRHRGPWRARA